MKKSDASKPIRFWLSALLSAVMCGAAALAQPANPNDEAAAIAPVGPIVIFYVLHFAPEPRGDVMKHADGLLRTRFSKLKRLTARDESATVPAVHVEVLDMKEIGVEPPSVDSLRYSGRGVSREQAQAMQKSTKVAVVKFIYPAADRFVSLEQANQLIQQLASQSGGLILDGETREIFAPAEWSNSRLAKGSNGFPDVSRHITIHAYPSGNYVRAITLGMTKFGLPDLVIDQFPWSLERQVGTTLNLFAQSLIEGATPSLGSYDFDVSKTKHARMRSLYEDHLLDGAQPVARLTLDEAVADRGDPENRLIELRFDRYEGRSTQEKQQQFANGFYGFKDNVTYVAHDDALRAASERARQRLPALRKAFAAGLAPAEHILLKAPFDTADEGTEWMWVEVTSWNGDEVTGVLANEPRNVPGLRAGATVKVREQDVFDYLRVLPDGTTEGNETGKEIAKAQK